MNKEQTTRHLRMIGTFGSDYTDGLDDDGNIRPHVRWIEYCEPNTRYLIPHPVCVVPDGFGGAHVVIGKLRFKVNFCGILGQWLAGDAYPPIVLYGDRKTAEDACTKGSENLAVTGGAYLELMKRLNRP